MASKIGKRPASNFRDVLCENQAWVIKGPEVTSEEGNGTPLQYSCPENPMDGGAWRAVVHGVAKNQTRLK